MEYEATGILSDSTTDSTASLWFVGGLYAYTGQTRQETPDNRFNNLSCLYAGQGGRKSIIFNLHK